mmetsp:Transcript_19374/g.61684  ORF Transcript_19374/g.61684 Transcript_19374/m.61684 type:complete len:257 (+) Transcript_19374:2486-3256(+)
MSYTRVCPSCATPKNVSVVSSSRYALRPLFWKSMPRYEMSIRSHWPDSTSTAHGIWPPSLSSPLGGRSYSVVMVHDSKTFVVACILVTREQSKYSRCGSRQQYGYESTSAHGGWEPERCLLKTGAMLPSAYSSRSSKSHRSGPLYLRACSRWYSISYSSADPFEPKVPPPSTSSSDAVLGVRAASDDSIVAPSAKAVGMRLMVRNSRSSIGVDSLDGRGVLELLKRPLISMKRRSLLGFGAVLEATCAASASSFGW